MSEVTGKFQGLIVAATGKGKNGQWTAYRIKVDGTDYGAGFDPVQAAVGDTVQFTTETNDKGYEQVAKGSFKVVKSATAAESSTAQTSAVHGESDRQRSIELQVCLKAAVEIMAAKLAVGMADADSDVTSCVTALVRDFMGILHPKAKPKAVAPPPPPPPVTQPEFDDDIPY